MAVVPDLIRPKNGVLLGVAALILAGASNAMTLTVLASIADGPGYLVPAAIAVALISLLLAGRLWLRREPWVAWIGFGWMLLELVAKAISRPTMFGLAVGLLLVIGSAVAVRATRLTKAPSSIVG